MIRRPVARLALASLATVPLQTVAATIVVGPPPASIQAAIDAASTGDTIRLAAGTYVQEFKVVSKNLTIEGAGRDATIVQAPPAATRLTQSFAFGGVTWWAVVLVDNQAVPAAQTVVLADLTVDGGTQQDTTVPPIYGSSDRFAGIGFHEANGTVRDVHVTNTRQTANFNELAGTGIVNASSVATVAFGVEGSLVDDYQRGGLDFRGATLTADVTDTTVDRGYVLPMNTVTATPNGIQFSQGASGSVSGSTVKLNQSTVAGVSGAGLILFGAGSVAVTGNAFDSNDVALYASGTPDGFVVDGNAVTFTQAPGVGGVLGIAVFEPLGSTSLTSNVIDGLSGPAMQLLSTPDRAFALSGNRFTNDASGLEVTGAGTTGPIVTMSGDRFHGIAGDYIALATAPHDVWPTTASVRFDGRISGQMSVVQFNQVLAKIVDRHNDPALGLVLDFIEPIRRPPPQPVPIGGGGVAAMLGVALALAAIAVLRRRRRERRST